MASNKENDVLLLCDEAMLVGTEVSIEGKEAENIQPIGSCEVCRMILQFLE